MNQYVKQDIEAFRQELKGVQCAFRWMPSQNHGRNIQVATTSTAILTIVMNNVKDVCEWKDLSITINRMIQNVQGRLQKGAGGNIKGKIKAIMRRSDENISDEHNPFDAVLLLRAISYAYKRHGKSLNGDTKKSIKEIVSLLSAGENPLWMRIEGISYPPHPALGYWLIDAISKFIDRDVPNEGESPLFEELVDVVQWESLARWLSRVFYQQCSWCTIQDSVRSDPISLAMAASALRKLREEVFKSPSINNDILYSIPSTKELMFGVKTFFRYQEDDGNWRHYFPIFYYKGTGANYCWSYEALEAILNEFSQDILSDDIEYYLDRLERSVSWLNHYRLTYKPDGVDRSFEGWNAGGRIRSLEGRIPEMWATGVAHIFLRKLRDTLSYWIQQEILREFDALLFIEDELERKKVFNNVVDSCVDIYGKQYSLVDVIKISIADHLADKRRYGKKLDIRSVLFFGPPGTGKTRLARSLARYMGWPFITITPTSFLRDGFENIYRRTSDIFSLLFDLRYVVVLFDEIDALLLRRSHDRYSASDVVQQFLTTMMLPHLAQLYDNGRVLFIVATNHLRLFDEAIIRPGRFDVLLCIGPPDANMKLRQLDKFIPRGRKQFIGEIKAFFQERRERKIDYILEYSTYSEFSALLDYLYKVCGESRDISECLNQKILDITNWKEYMTIREGSEVLEEFRLDRTRNRFPIALLQGVEPCTSKSSLSGT